MRTPIKHGITALGLLFLIGASCTQNDNGKTALQIALTQKNAELNNLRTAAELECRKKIDASTLPEAQKAVAREACKPGG